MYYYDRHYTGHEEPERPTRRGTKRYRDKDAPKRALYVKLKMNNIQTEIYFKNALII